MEKSIRNKGITLVALVVTIIILLILAGISIQILSQMDLIEKAKQAKTITENAQKKENEEITKIEDLMYDNINDIEQVTDKEPGKLEQEENNNDIYIINSIEDLVYFAYDVTNGNSYLGKTVKLGINLDFNSSKSYVDAYRTDYTTYGYDGALKEKITKDGFIPIGKINYTENTKEDILKNNSFNGTFDGNGYVINNLKINEKTQKQDEWEEIGLFTRNRGTIQNLKLTNVNINFEISNNVFSSVSALVGVNYATIKQCYVTGKINGITNKYSLNIGGITASNWGTILECVNKTNVYSTMNTNSDVFPALRIGGIAGINENGGNINNVYNNGEIHNVKSENSTNNYEFIGGVVGNNSGTLINSYNRGVVENSNINYYIRIGSLTGASKTTLDTCYYLKDTVINLPDDNTVIMSLGTQVDEQEIKDNNFITKLNENNSNIWKSDINNINDNYPILYWQ